MTERRRSGRDGPRARRGRLSRGDPATSRGLVVDAVESGAGVNFLAGVTADEAGAWWAERIELVADGTISPFAALRWG